MKQKRAFSNIAIIIAILTVMFLLIGLISNTNLIYASAAGNEQYTTSPVITILTHGLGGDPSDWSHKGTFSFQRSKEYGFDITYGQKDFMYSANSIIETLRRKNTNTLVYVVSEKDNGSAPDIDRFDVNTSSDTGYSATKVTLPDFSKHSILVYNSCNDDKDSTDTVYGRFKATIDYIVNAYKNAYNGTYPKINLIGHSRGSIINLKYATEYPDRVATMVGLGSPYNGAELAKIVYDLNLKNKIGSLGNMFDSEFVEEIANNNFMQGIRTDWNNAVAGKSIKAYAVSSGFDVDFLKTFVTDSNQITLNEAARVAIRAAITALQKAYLVGGVVTKPIELTVVKAICHIYGITGLNETHENAFADKIGSFISTVGGNAVIGLDGFLTKSSQAADGYNNFSRFYRNYGRYTDLTHISQDNVEFPHNLETQDLQTVKYVASKIDMGVSQQYEYTVKADNTVRIDNVNNSSSITNTTLTLPSTLGGKTVTEIAPYAFANNFQGNENITSVIIPATVKEIGMGAFENCDKLKTVSFASGSVLDTVRAYAFSGCTSLTSITLPSSARNIFEYAFNGCMSLTSFNLNNVTTLYPGVFAGCAKLTTFSKNSANKTLTIDGNIAVYNSNILCAYAVGNTSTTYSVKANTTRIEEGAFKGAKNLASITLPQELTDIGNYAFDGCTKITNIVIHQLCGTIGTYAFNSCALNSVTMYSTGNIQFGMGAFNGISDTAKIYVPNSRLSYYRNADNLDVADANVQPITFKLTLDKNDGTAAVVQDVLYGGTVKLPMDFTKAGYAFEGWYRSETDNNGSGAKFASGSMYTDKGNITLYAKWVAKADGNIKFNANGGEGVMDDIKVKYNQTVTIPTAKFTKLGYDFVGWAEDPKGAVVYKAGTSYKFTLDENSTTTFYAKWEAHRYQITYNGNNKQIDTGSYPTYYTVETTVYLPKATSPGYTFYGWSYDTYYILTDTEGYNVDLNLKAEWTVTYAMGSNTPLYINEVSMILDFSGYSLYQSVNKTFTISNKAAALTIKNANNLKELYFVVEKGRPTDMDIIIDNASFTGKEGCNAIYAGGSEVNLYCNRSSTITGGLRTVEVINLDAEELLTDCSAAIMCATLNIMTYSGGGTLTLQGGTGKTGSAGASGTNGGNDTAGGRGSDGGDGIRGGFGVVAGKVYIYSTQRVNIYGGNGGNGGVGGRGGNSGALTGTPSHGQVGATGLKGGNGGNGGKGGGSGVAVFSMFKNDFVDGTNVHLRNGTPGNGGNGGMGGTGGRGQKGGPGKFGVPAAKGGTGGTGGNGGKGGDVYAIATSCFYSFAVISKTTNYVHETPSKTVGTPGQGGAGGSGGAGGEGGNKWPTNNLADSGANGAYGIGGSVGTAAE